MSSRLTDFNARNKNLTAKLLQQVYHYHKLRKAFPKFYRLVSKYKIELRSLLQQGLSEPEFYGDLIYKFREIVGKTECFGQLNKQISCYINA